MEDGSHCVQNDFVEMSPIDAPPGTSAGLVRSPMRTGLLAVGWGDKIGHCDNVCWVRAEGWQLLKRGKEVIQKT